MEVVINVSNRHVHLCEKDLKILFGENFELTKKKDLVQPGEFASESTLTIKTEKSIIENVRVLGPIRNYTQVEISKTDAYKLGVNPPVRDSGDLEGSEKVTLIGPNGSVELDKGCIIATRHIHMTPDDVKKFGFEGLDVVNVKVGGEKGALLYNVHLKVSEKFKLEMHIDTDDANALLLKSGTVGEIILWEKMFLKV